jgi:hypothetical protein
MQMRLAQNHQLPISIAGTMFAVNTFESRENSSNWMESELNTRANNTPNSWTEFELELIRKRSTNG